MTEATQTFHPFMWELSARLLTLAGWDALRLVAMTAHARGVTTMAVSAPADLQRHRTAPHRIVLLVEPA